MLIKTELQSDFSNLCVSFLNHQWSALSVWGWWRHTEMTPPSRTIIFCILPHTTTAEWTGNYLKTVVVLWCLTGAFDPRRHMNHRQTRLNSVSLETQWNCAKKIKKERKKTGAGVEINFKSIEPHISIDLNAMKMAKGRAVSSPLTWCSCFYFHSCFNQLALKVRPTPEDWRTTALEVTWLNDLQSQWRSSINQSEFEFALATPRPLG